MLTVDDYAQIREARRDGASIRELAQRFRRSPKTILKVLSNAQPQPYTLTKPRPAPVFDAVRPIVDEILAHDLNAPTKQRHTATQIFRRLVAEHGYTGSYHPVQRHLQKRRLDRRETFIRKRPAKYGSCVVGYDEAFPSECLPWRDPICAIPNSNSSGARS